MRIILISTPTRTYAPNPLPPLGIMSLAAHMERLGHSVRILDGAALRKPHEEIASLVSDFAPDLIGVGGIITAYAYIIGLTHALRRAMPRAPIVLGGQVAINTADLCFQHMAVDYIVHGYGEIALEKLVRHLEGDLRIEDIPGLSYRREGAAVDNPGREYFPCMEDVPLPAYHLVDMEHYATVNGIKSPKLQKYLEQTGKSVKNHRYAPVMGTLGCTDRCTFCVHEQEFVGLKIFPTDRVIENIRFLRDTYDIHVVSIGEEMFLTTLHRAQEFNRRMKEELPDVYWSSSTRANHVTPELIRELETGNCFYIAWGFESGSQRMLDLMKKRITRRQNIDAYRLVDSSKVVASASLMVGNVGEDDHSVKDTISAVHEAGIFSATPFFATPYPGGRTWDWAVERGIIPDRHEYLLKVSDQDAASRIHCNLTPYPDFILKTWQRMIQWACAQEEQKNAVHIHIAITPLQRLKAWLRLWFGFYLMPTPLLPLFVDIYFLAHRLRKRVWETERDRCCAHRTDPDGGLSVEHLRVGKPQTWRVQASANAH
ncbi:MAG: radical SAM protein [Elusimicrobiota bacterium]|jgi:radical SAM superfamily enzyme YgiQ (UPF0313 family)